MAKRFRASVAGACHPLTDGAFADAEGLGDLALGPALLLEAPGSEPSGFSPVVGCRAHAWEYSTDTSRALDVYTRVSKITIIDIKGRQVRIGVEAPPDVTVHREELWERISTENRTAAALSPLTLSAVKELWKQQHINPHQQKP